MKQFGILFSALLFLTMCSAQDGSESGDPHADVAGFPVEAFARLQMPFLMMAMPCVKFQTEDNINGEGQAEIILYIDRLHDEATLALNNEILELEQPSPAPMYLAGYSISPGDTIAYEVYIDNQYRSGSLVVPGAIEVHYPDSLEVHEDAMVFWEHPKGAETPDLYLTRLTAGQSHFAPADIDDVGGIGGEEQMFAFDHREFRSLIIRDQWYLNAMIQAVNYEEIDGMYMMAVCYDRGNFQSQPQSSPASQDTLGLSMK